MSLASESFYIAARVVDLPFPDTTSVQERCVQCGEKVWIHIEMLKIAVKSKGVLCMPCVQELENKPFDQLVVENIDNMVEILEEESAQNE